MSVGPDTIAPSETEEDDVAVTIDCDRCEMRALACHDCVVTALLGPPPESGFDDDETRALGVLAESGLVPRLRMVHPTGSIESEAG